MIIPEVSLNDVVPEFQKATDELHNLVAEMKGHDSIVTDLKGKIEAFNTEFADVGDEFDTIKMRYLRLYNLGMRLQDFNSEPIKSMD
jgi:hypothetical protein